MQGIGQSTAGLQTDALSRTMHLIYICMGLAQALSIGAKTLLTAGETSPGMRPTKDKLRQAFRLSPQVYHHIIKVSKRNKLFCNGVIGCKAQLLRQQCSDG